MEWAVWECYKLFAVCEHWGVARNCHSAGVERCFSLWSLFWMPIIWKVNWRSYMSCGIWTCVFGWVVPDVLKAKQSFRIPGISCLMIWCHILGNLKFQQHHGNSVKSHTDQKKINQTELIDLFVGSFWVFDNWLAPWNKVPQKLTGLTSRLEFPHHVWNIMMWRFVGVLPRVFHWTLFWSRWLQSTATYGIKPV